MSCATVLIAIIGAILKPSFLVAFLIFSSRRRRNKQRKREEIK